MTKVSGPIVAETIIGSRGKFKRLKERWGFYSDYLKCWSWAEVGFVWDEESIPLYKGGNPMGGLAHDLVCRSNFKAESGIEVTKIMAALIYEEISACEDGQSQCKPDTKNSSMSSIYKAKDSVKKFFLKCYDHLTRHVKRDVVIVAPEYFHKHTIEATYEELSA